MAGQLLAGGRYPDLIGAFFLMIMAVAALIRLYVTPSARSGPTVTVVGASVVLYHPVASLNRGITNRAVLAMGGYAGLQSYRSRRIAHPRSLPPAGRQPLLDSRKVLLHPASCQAAGIIHRDDVRYVVLYKSGRGADLARVPCRCRAVPPRVRELIRGDLRSVFATVSSQVVALCRAGAGHVRDPGAYARRPPPGA